MSGAGRRVAVAVLVAVAAATACADTPPAQLPPPPSGTEAAASPSQTPATEIVPTPEPLPDGSVAAVGDPAAGGLVYIVWRGTAERIQQPAPMDRATLREIGVRIAAPVARFTARRRPDPRTFWVVFPPSGRRARLHLAIADRLYPVVTVPAHQWQIDRLEPPRRSLLNRMRPAR